MNTAFRVFVLTTFVASISVPASAGRLVSATLGLNYIGQGHCIVVNGGNGSADARVSIIDAPTANMVAGGGVATILPGTSMTLPYQATTANRRDYFCEVTDATPGAELRMVFKRVNFNGDVSDFSDGLPSGGSGTNGDSSVPGSPGLKTIFVSSSVHTGDLGGLEGADAICQGLADSASSAAQEGEYVALLSTAETHARDRVTRVAGPYRMALGLPVAEDFAALFGTRDAIVDARGLDLLTRVFRDEVGTAVEPVNGPETWTNSTSIGTFLDFGVDACAGWTSADPQLEGRYGLTSERNAKWLDFGTGSCDVPRHIYCIQR